MDSKSSCRTTFGTAHSSPNRLEEGSACSDQSSWPSRLSDFFNVLKQPLIRVCRWEIYFVERRARHLFDRTVLVHQLDRDRGLVISTSMNCLKIATIFLLLPSLMKFFVSCKFSFKALIIKACSQRWRVSFEDPGVLWLAASLDHQYLACCTPIVLHTNSSTPPIALLPLSGSVHFRHPPDEILNWKQTAMWAHVRHGQGARLGLLEHVQLLLHCCIMCVPSFFSYECIRAFRHQLCCSYHLAITFLLLEWLVSLKGHGLFLELHHQDTFTATLSEHDVLVSLLIEQA